LQEAMALLMAVELAVAFPLPANNEGCVEQGTV
jgi:hypothetical protein